MEMRTTPAREIHSETPARWGSSACFTNRAPSIIGAEDDAAKEETPRYADFNNHIELAPTSARSGDYSAVSWFRATNSTERDSTYRPHGLEVRHRSKLTDS